MEVDYSTAQCSTLVCGQPERIFGEQVSHPERFSTTCQLQYVHKMDPLPRRQNMPGKVITIGLLYCRRLKSRAHRAGSWEHLNMWGRNTNPTTGAEHLAQALVVLDMHRMSQLASGVGGEQIPEATIQLAHKAEQPLESSR